MVVRTTRNAVLGGYADSAWEPHMQGGACYYGSANAFSSKWSVIVSAKRKSKSFTGAERIDTCNCAIPVNKMLAFGGGGDDGAFGLSLEDDFQKGSTGHCATFDNEPLCDEENFDIVDMEVFGFLVGQF